MNTKRRMSILETLSLPNNVYVKIMIIIIKKRFVNKNGHTKETVFTFSAFT